MNRIAQHQFLARYFLQVLDGDILFVLVLKHNDLALANAAMVFLPKKDVLSFPIARRIAGVSYFTLQIAVRIGACRSDRLPVNGTLAFFECGFCHTSME